MKIIDNYLDKVYKDDTSNEVNDIKEEIKEHLTSLSNEFMDKGYNSDDAQKKALVQFYGDELDFSEVRSIYSPKIDLRKQRLNKLMGIKWKFINIFGWLFGACCLVGIRNSSYSGEYGIFGFLPPWLALVLGGFIIAIVVISIMISKIKKSIEEN